MDLFKRIGMAVAATAVATMPIAAYAAQRAPALDGRASELGGEGVGNAFIVIAIAGAGMAVLLLTDDDEEPVSR